MLAWSGRADPDGNLHQFLSCKGPLNDSGYCKNDVEALINEARTSLDPTQRAAAYEKIAQQVQKDRPIVYLFHRNWLWAHNAKLTGLRTVPDGMVRVQGLKNELRCCATCCGAWRTIVPTLFFVSVLIFGLQQLLPGDPAIALAGEERDPETVAYLRAKFHLDEPLPMRYWYWALAACCRATSATRCASRSR